MPTARFLVNTASYGSTGRYPSSLSAQAILQNTTNSSYVYVDNGSSTAPAYGSLSFAFSSSAIASTIGATGIIEKCTFGIYGVLLDSLNYYYSNATISLSNRSLVELSGEMDVWTTKENSFSLNPVTNAKWKATDFQDDMLLALETEGQYGIRVAYIYVDIEYIAHEVLRTPEGKIKVKLNSKNIELPFFATYNVSYPALRIFTSKSGISAFSLVDTTDSYASPIRVKTPKGIKAIAYVK